MQPINSLSGRSPSPAQLVGPYRIEHGLGQGGMGMVYRGIDTRNDMPVAIKYVAEWNDEEHLRRLRREARTISRLEHPSIVRLIDVLEHEGVWLVMELIEGTTVHSMLTGQQPVDSRKAVDIARHVALGLVEAHAKGVLHRDLKSENVMVTPQGEVKLLDFGLAKLLMTGEDSGTLTEPGEVMGTCRAMSPEQARGQDLDGRSDLFALGVLLYEMTTGESPFEASTPLATMNRVCEFEPLPAQVRNSDVPLAVSDLIERLLAKHRDDRPLDATDVASQLEHLTRGGSTSMADGAAGQSWMPQSTTAMLGLGALAAVALMTSGLWLAQRAEPLTPTPADELLRGPTAATTAHNEAIRPTEYSQQSVEDGTWQMAESAADALANGDLERARADARLVLSSQPPAAAEIFAHRVMARADVESGYLPSARRWLEDGRRTAEQHTAGSIDLILDLAQVHALEDNLDAARRLVRQAAASSAGSAKIDPELDNAALATELDRRFAERSEATSEGRVPLPPCLATTADAIRQAELQRDISILERIIQDTANRDLVYLHLKARLARALLSGDATERASAQEACRQRGFMRLARRISTP